MVRGQEYDALYRLHVHDMYGDRGAAGSFREEWELRNQVAGAVFGLTCVVRWRMDADRDILVSREQERVVCR